MRDRLTRVIDIAVAKPGLIFDAIIATAVYVVSYFAMIPYLNPSLFGMRGKQHFWGDEGTVLHHANRILHGEVLYRDFFDFQGLFGFLPFTLGFAIGGATPTVGRLTMIVLMAIWCSVLYLTVKEITLKRWAGILVALYFALCVWPTFPYAYQHFIADLWLTAALLFSIWGERDVLAKGWQWGGVFLALAVWTSVSEGLPGMVAIFGCCAVFRYARRDGWERLGQLTKGFFSFTFIYAAYLAGSGTLKRAFHAELVFPFTTYGLENATKYAFDAPDYIRHWKTSPHAATVERMVNMTMDVPKWGIPLAFMVALLLVDRVAYSYYRRAVKTRGIPWSTLAPCILAASLAGLAVPVVSGTTRNDICHLGFVQQMSVIAMCVLWAPISKESLKKLRWKVAFAAQLLLGGYVALVDWQSWKFLRTIALTAKTATVRRLEDDASAQYNCKSMRARTRPEDTVIIHYGGMGYLTCQRNSAISFPHLFHAPYWEAQWPVAAREIVKKRPRVMYISAQDFQRFSTDQPMIRSLYFAADGGSYVLAEGRPGPPLVTGTWSYTLTGPAGHIVRGRMKLEQNPSGPTPFKASFDEAKPLMMQVDGSMVQLFEATNLYTLERDATGKTMTGLVWTGETARHFEAELVEASNETPAAP